MPPEKQDAAYLWDMLEAAREVVALVVGMRHAQYVSDRKTQLAVERAVEIIGEAARKISDGYKAAHGAIPWRKIIAQRHVLAHEYGEIKQDRMWVVATVNVPELIGQLEAMIPPLPPEIHE
jgi:uncharacterized protein with HEPN domain